MSELLKNLTEKEESSIPLLINEIDTENEESTLFTDDEIRASHKRRVISNCFKLFLPTLFLIIIILVIGIKTFSFISYKLSDQKIEYQLHSLSVQNAYKDSILLSLNATVDPKLPWSLDLNEINIDLLDDGLNSIVSTKINSKFDLISGESIPINLFNQSIKINSPKSLAKLINKSIDDKKIKIPLRISTSVHPYWVPYTFKKVQIDKDIEMDFSSDGMPTDSDLSKYVKLLDLKMEEAANDDLIITAKLHVVNPLPVSIDKIPQISFKIYSKNHVFIGKARTLQNIKLKRNGASIVYIQGHLSPSSNSKTSDAIGELITNHLMGKESKIYLQGDKEGFPEENLNWLQSILIHLNVPIIIPGNKKSFFKSASARMFEDSIRKIDVKRMNFSLDPNKPDQIALDSDAEVHFNVPRFAKMLKPTVESLSLEGRVTDQNGNFIAPILIPFHQIDSGLSHQNSLSTNMKLDISVNHLNLANVESLMAEMLYAQDTTISISGHSSVKTKMIIGKVNVPRVPFSTEIKLPGLGRILSSQEPEITLTKIQSYSEKELIFSGNISINNPTEITSEMGWIQMNLMTETDRVNVGTVILENVSIYPNENNLGVMLSIPIDSGKAFLQELFEKGELNVILQGVPRSELIHPILKNVIGAFVMKGKVTEKFGSFVSSIILRRKGFNLIPQAYMKVSNPFPVPMKIVSVKNLYVYAYKTSDEMVLITKMLQVPLEEPIIIPPNVENWIDEDNPLPLEINGNILRSLKAIELLFNKDNPKDSEGKRYLPTRIEARVKSEMAGIELELMFIKDRLPLYLELN